MKILTIDLIAFGPFTDKVLDLSAGQQGLHMVYGPNEAGKSSALRAIRQLLYGIPERSRDDFIHPFAKLRIGGKLKSAQGEVLEIIRRKGRGGTLRGADDQSAVDESRLQRFLNGIDAALFTVMFGIGYEDLVAGGREILQGKGEIGRLIFAAGSGAANLGEVVAGLQAEADALFRPSGQKQKINEAVARLKQRRADLKEAQLPGQQWVSHDRALKTAIEAKTGVDAKLTEAQRHLSRLQRIKQAHPVIAARREILKALALVSDAVLLPEGFAERRVDALTRLRVAQSGRTQADANLEALRKAVADLLDPSGLLTHAEGIEALHQELGSQRKAAKDRIALETRRKTLRAEALQVLRNLREDLSLDDAEKLRIKKPEAVRIQELGVEYERIATRIDTTREGIPQQARLLAAVVAQLEVLPKPRPVEPLKHLLAEAEEKLPLEKQLAAMQARAAELLQACNQLKARLGLDGAALDGLMRLPVPSMETLGLFEARWAELERRLTMAAEEMRKTDTELSEIARRLDEARLAQEVPTEADLANARATRDQGWRLIRQQLQGEEVGDAALRDFMACYPGVTTLPDAFASGLRRSDEISDRLRREAGRVAEKARLLADQAALGARQAQLAGEAAALQGEKEASGTEWSGVWSPLSITPRSPREMRQWIADFRVLTDKADEALKREKEAGALVTAIDGCRETLGKCLQTLLAPLEPGERLGVLVLGARSLIAKEEDIGRQMETLSRERARLAEELETGKSRLATLEEGYRHWQTQWEQAVRPLGLGGGTRPAEANAVMEELKNFFDKLREAEILRQRIDGIDRDAEAFGHKVAALAGVIAADLVARPADEAAGELQRRLTGCREAHSKRQTLQKQIDQELENIRKAGKLVVEIESLLQAMCAEAGCANNDALPEAERRSTQRRELEARRRQAEERLVQLGGGAALEAFIEEVSAVDPDGIDGQIECLKEENGKLGAEKSELDQGIGGERTELARMDGGDKAAAIAEEIQGLMGGIEREAEHYARLKIAGRVLAMAMERFREKSQGPILGKASGLFGRITRGAFEGLRADQDADGHPVLVGVRQGGKEIVPVEGMSDGTADQLFLALRLAGLDHYLAANEPMPFIVDDILIKFDNMRAQAALQALAELSKKTQVIFFTHHQHFAEMAQQLIDPGLLVTHEL